MARQGWLKFVGVKVGRVDGVLVKVFFGRYLLEMLQSAPVFIFHFSHIPAQIDVPHHHREIFLVSFRFLIQSFKHLSAQSKWILFTKRPLAENITSSLVGVHIQITARATLFVFV